MTGVASRPLTGMTVSPAVALLYATFLAAVNASAAYVASSAGVAEALHRLLVEVVAVSPKDLPAAGALLSAVIMVALYGVMLLPVFFMAGSAGMTLSEATGLRRFRVGRAAMMTVGLTCVGIIASVVYGLTMSRAGIRVPTNTVAIVGGFGDGPLSMAVAFLLVGIVAPFVEEVAFRGVIFAGLRQAWGTWTAAAVSGLAFGALHLMPLQVIPLMLIGIALAFVFLRARSLWPAVIAHCAYNSVVLALAFALSDLVA